MSDNPLYRKLSFVIVFSLTLSVYLNTLYNGFVFDDIQNILGNRWIKDIRYIPDIFSNHIAGFLSGYPTSYYRPLVHLIYMLDYHLFGLQPWGFHLVNILFHVSVSVLVFLIASRLLEEKYDATSLLSPSLIAALLFATHPIHTEAVSWIAGIMDLSYTFFYLLSYYLYMRSGDVDRSSKGFYILSVVFFSLSALCKEPGLSLPFLLFIHDITFRKGKFYFSEYAKRYIPYLFIATLYFVIRIYALEGFAPSKSMRGLTNYQFFINIFPLFMKYLVKLVLPVNLNAMHVFNPIYSIFEFKAVVSIVLASGVVLFIFIIRKERIVPICLAFLVIPLIPSLYIPGIAGEVVFAERYLYLPSLGFVLLIALLIGWAKKNTTRRYHIFLAVFFYTLAAVYSIGTIGRNFVWKNSKSLWSDTVKKSPGSAAAHEFLGYALYIDGSLDKAIEEYQIALTLSPDRADAHINLGLAYHRKGWIDRAIEQYMIGLGLQPDDAVGNLNIGLAYISKGWVEQAIERCQYAIRIDPYFADAHNCLGSAYANKGFIDKAIEHFRTAVQMDPGNAIFRGNMEKAYRIINGR